MIIIPLSKNPEPPQMLPRRKSAHPATCLLFGTCHLSEKEEVFAEYGLPYSLYGNYEVDHFVSLELGGDN
jgi:hypothetical protein